MHAQNTSQVKRTEGTDGLESQISKRSQGGEIKNKGLFGRFCETLRFGNLGKFLFGCAAGALIGGMGTSQKANAEFVISERTKVPNINTQYGELEPCISADGLELYFRSARPGGYGNWDLYFAKRDSIFHPWRNPVNLGRIVNDAYHIEGPSISADGLKLYFSSSRPGVIGWIGVDTDWDIWVTKRETKDSSWQTPTNSGELALVNSSRFDLFPSISADNSELYFDRGGDILVSSWNNDSNHWQAPKNFNQINSKYIESYPFLSYDGLTFYFSGHSFEGETGYGGRDIFASTRTSKESNDWSTPRNLGPNVNNSFWEMGPKASADGQTLYFTVMGPGISPDDYAIADIYQVSITPVIDFNADGKVDSVDLEILEGHLGEQGDHVAYVDIYPSPIGDGKIDERDLNVFYEESSKEDGLMAHWKLDETGENGEEGNAGDIAYDAISGFNGSVFGEPVWQPDIGKIGGALLLDGVDDYISAPFVWNPAYGEFSAFAWVFGGDLGQVIISQTDDFRNNRRTWLGVDSLERKLMTGLTSGGRSRGNLVSESTISDNEWNHLGVVWDGSRRHLYLNGEEVVGDIVDMRQLLESYGGLYFGAGKNLEAGSFLDGFLDDIKIYAKSLSNEEVRKLYTEGSIAPYTGISPGTPPGIPVEPPVTPTLSTEDFETRDFSKFDWISYGDADWFVTTGGYSGNYGARAGYIGDDGSSSLEVEVDCAEGEISFYRKISSESGWDFLRFYIDREKKGEWAGEQDWTYETFPVTSGRRTFTWIYSKDESSSDGYDTAWIDDVSFPVN